MAEYNDRDLTCQDCGDTFVFTADDQSYHAEKGFTNEPKRCAPCRQTRRGQRGGGGGSAGARRPGARAAGVGGVQRVRLSLTSIIGVVFPVRLVSRTQRSLRGGAPL